MPTNRLSRSIPFWVLVGGSVAAIAGGSFLLINKLTVMAVTLTDGSATGVEVYAGQSWALAGAVLIGAGLVGLALALTLGALRSILAPAATVEVVDAPAWDDEVVSAPTYAAAAAAEPVAAEPDVEDAAEATAEDDAPATAPRA